MIRARVSVLPAAAMLAAILLPAAWARAAVTPARAARGAPDSPTVDSAAAAKPDTARAAAARAEAEKRYREGRAFVARGREDLAAGRAPMARKRFGKARSLLTQATQLDPRYPGAWSLLGYCARQCGDLNLALDAYGKCLAIQPDDEEAHAFRGRTYLELSQLEKARAELAWLRERGSAEAESLAVKLAEAERGGARAWEPRDSGKPSDADSTRAGRKSSGDR